MPNQPGSSTRISRQRSDRSAGSPTSRTGCRDGCGDFPGLLVRKRAAVEQETTVADHADNRRVAGPQRGGELLLDRAGEARELRERERAAADPRDGFLDLA